ncbi:mannose-1-phosphate guanylyltransferase/mannose-6-phosphate isomerase [Paraburkholderia azotifigens]|uniref:mannose-1-phosphate guanylyltransferase n=1 Tax=Paraburkholderia azotifigens TaxID=2057004 RepID=A0A5C6VEV1_9BURK|nr:mannose-1-phosphate guanylyltransferase/mannose-6-phosphate isomerase [Paraburkholderia azotifigens]TXC82345.1 mannose-1-phosphate guanylyltransferase/mannose-6-phosphate isomerase [Paraburkholderia azotifigens]
MKETVELLEADDESRESESVGMPLMVHSVVLAGGSGTRLWPVSRQRRPKQLIPLVGEDSLLQSTVKRVDNLSSGIQVNQVLTVVCNEEHRFETAEQLRVCGKPHRIILEPSSRNTAPALTVAALSIVARHGDGIMVVMPADHSFDDIRSFQSAVEAGVAYAEKGNVVTLGVVPDRPETGYGYIRLGLTIGSLNNGGIRQLDGFVEKPSFEVAQEYLDSGNYCWNSGIFIMCASVWLRAIHHYHPEISSACDSAYKNGSSDRDFFRLEREAFESSPSDSIDYAVMEKLGCRDSICAGVVVPIDAGWSDLGTWDAIWKIMNKDPQGNASGGNGMVIFEGASSTLVHSGDRLVACVGTSDIVVVETPDAILVANRSAVQDVKKLVERICDSHVELTVNHRKVHRPWGYYDSIDKGERFQVKRIVVNPGEALSLQMHHHRAEHWIVVRGTAYVTRGEERFTVSENQSTYIPLGVVHRLENPGRIPLEMIEVQSGSYLGEDDIVRLEDSYGRR